MGSFLKRISPLEQLNRLVRFNSSVPFEIDEPNFLLKRKFKSNSAATNKRKKSAVYSNHSKLNSCPNCGNVEFSLTAKYCKICGSDISSS